MTIKEIELESGMSRANIRFYEAEGLLNPERRANGYREYSDKDLETLKRIKLLRTLHISLDEIKRLHTGNHALVDTLDRHLKELQSEKTNLEQAQEICEVMRNDGVQYQTLNAQHYLDAIERSTSQPVSIPVSDIIPEVRIPWRRFFARSLDYAAYTTIWNVFLALILNININSRSTGSSALDGIVVIIIMFLLEPAMLSLFGTTLGKWILGIRITDNEGKLLTYRGARERTWRMLLRGWGLRIPFYGLYRQWMSYRANSDGETLEWEYHSAITLKDEKGWRIFAYLGMHAVLVGMLALAAAMAALPKNRGDITVAEFCQNYNRFAKYYGVSTSRKLDPQGHWVQDESLGTVIYFGAHDYPDFIFEETDGLMTGMHFSVNIQDGDEIIVANQAQMILSILAFAGAQKGNSLFSNQVEKIVEEMWESPFTNYQFSVYGVNITCEVAYSGYYAATMGILWPEDDTTSSYSYSLSFSMRKEALPAR